MCHVPRKRTLHYIFLPHLHVYESWIHPPNKIQFVTANTSQHKTIWNVFIEVWWHFSRCIIHRTHLFSRQLPPFILPLCFVFCHVPSLCYNYSLQGPSIHCDRAPLWWSGLCLSSHSWTIWTWTKSTSAGVMLLHFCTFSYKYGMPCHFLAWYIRDDATNVSFTEEKTEAKLEHICD